MMLDITTDAHERSDAMNAKISVLILTGLLGSAVARGAEKAKPAAQPKSSEVSYEQRQKLADIHEKTAACLRSNKPIEECHKEMMTYCHDEMGKEGCPMMGHMGKMHGKGK
jgi:hypothetical protein